jgi:hypothetical protein
MVDYWKPIAVVAVLIAGYQWYGQQQLTARLLKPDVGFYGGNDEPAWAQNGDPFGKGAVAYADDRTIHARCMKDVNVPSNSPGTGQSSADRYMICFTGAMQREPARLCDINARKALLWHLQHYAFALKWANYKQGSGQKPGTQPGSFKDTFTAVNAELHNAGSHQSDGGSRDAPSMNPSIIHALNTFVRHGLLSPDKDLKPVIDTSVLNENPTPAEFFTARKETCK